MGCFDTDMSNSVFRSSNWKTVKAILAEFLATAIFVFLGVASCLNWNHTMDHDQLIRIGLTFGIGIAGVIYAFGPISGGHLNPAVTVAFMIIGRLKVIPGILYIMAQSVGAVCGAGILYTLQQEDFIGEKSSQFGLTKVNPLLQTHQGLFIEVVTTTIFILVILLVTHECWAESTNGTVAIAIGFTLGAIHLGFINATGASVNPARSLGPAFIVMDFEGLWLYWLGPIAGAVIAVLFYKVFTWEPKAKIQTHDSDAQTLPTGEALNDNAVFVSSDLNSSTSYDEIVIEDEANDHHRK